MRPVPCQPWADAPRAALCRVRGVLTDIDDTLTTHGALTPDALAALHGLRGAGLNVIAITGRPMGWSEPFAGAPAEGGWPVDAIVAESGAVAMFREHGEQCTEYAQDALSRAHNTLRLRELAALVLREVPGATLARDSAGRVTDIAVDHSEFAHLGAEQIAQAVAVMQAAGAHATVSSIHINAWFGDHTKLTGARWAVQRVLGRTLDDELDRWVYVGDSTNDQLMFGHVPLSVGVANVVDFAATLNLWPAYITASARGAGFAEVAARLIGLAKHRADAHVKAPR